MAVRNVLLIGNPLLRQISDEVNDFSSELMDMIGDLRDTLSYLQNKYKIGRALAAPQIGLNYNLFVMGDTAKRYYCFNPIIAQFSEDFIVEYEEGCLSFPGMVLNIKRPDTIVGKWQDENGKTHMQTFDGLFGRCFQHEKDHLQRSGHVHRPRALQRGHGLAGRGGSRDE